ncbi:hypothetical protein [Nocardiopsis chromatogenes]|uniref:hypothetical protein n=1 Tax=Nocardiopsis chromatogenes TaxID=280239 RepID=UPI001268DD67|nr:hypothetical protein [Nocardiopsis chromatogenes]
MRPAVVFVVGGIVVLAGCTSSQSAEKPEVEPSASAPDTSGAEERALEAYEGMMQALVDGSHEGATESSEIDWYAKGQAAELTQEMLTGVEATGEPVFAPEVDKVDLDADPPTVTIEDCIDDNEWRIVEEDLDSLKGDLEDGEGPRPATAKVTEEAGSWRVAKLWFGEYGECEQ